MARIDKNTRMLGLYHELISGKSINKQAYCVENEVTERSFDRDIEDVRLYLSEKQPYCQLNYDRISNSYFLSHVVGKSLPGELVLFLADVMLSQKCISKDELEGILSNLIDITDNYRRNEVYHYVEKRMKWNITLGQKAILKMHWDLERAIQNQNQIEMYYEVNEENCELRKVQPVQLRVENGFSYLIAFILNAKYDKPAFFRLDRIKSFKILNERFQADIQKKYTEHNKAYDLFNMMAGEEIDIIVRVSRRMRRVLCDVFPKCVLVEVEGEKNKYKIKTYKQGFLQWVMGQEEVEVLEPEELKNEIREKLTEILKQYEGKE